MRWLLTMAIAALVVGAPSRAAADDWIEVKSAHFSVVSNAGERTTRRLVWQLEQVRSVAAALWSWAKPDLNKPLAVIVLKDENSMRAFAPQYWEERRAIRPASVWVTGPDQHYLAIRADVEIEDRGTINPYVTAYGSYISLVLRQSVSHALPLWLERGFTGVLSNTIVRDDHVLLGAPIPWELEILRERPLLPLPKLVAVTRGSPDDTVGDKRQVYDAETWAFVHFLMFGDGGIRSGKLNDYAKLVSAGKESAAAFAESLGPIEALQDPFSRYYQRSIFSYRRINIDVSVERERFPVRPLTAVDAATLRGSFHAAMHRPVEARAAIAEARKANPAPADSYVAEGVLADSDSKRDEARAAFGKAVQLGSRNAYAYYRYASLIWPPNPSRDALTEIEKLLTTAVSINQRYAAAYAWLGDVRAYLDSGEAIGLIRRAISIEPLEASHRLRAANVLVRQKKPAEARIEAQAALTLAENDSERREAERLLQVIAKMPQGGDASK